MHRRSVAMIAALAATPTALAQNPNVDHFVEELPAPPGIFVVDVGIDLHNADAWTASAIIAEAFSGATFRYALDPNTGEPLPTNIEPDNIERDRNVSFVSQPRPQTADSRFRANGATQLPGGYPGGIPNALEPQFLRVAFFDEVPPGEEKRDGYITRVAADVPPGVARAVPVPGPDPRSPDRHSRDLRYLRERDGGLADAARPARLGRVRRAGAGDARAAHRRCGAGLPGRPTST